MWAAVCSTLAGNSYTMMDLNAWENAILGSVQAAFDHDRILYWAPSDHQEQGCWPEGGPCALPR